MGIFVSFVVIILTIVTLEEVPMRLDSSPVLLVIVGFAVFMVNVVFRALIW